jgi:hypothetical protein
VQVEWVNTPAGGWFADPGVSPMTVEGEHSLTLKPVSAPAVVFVPETSMVNVPPGLKHVWLGFTEIEYGDVHTGTVSVVVAAWPVLSDAEIRKVAVEPVREEGTQAKKTLFVPDQVPVAVKLPPNGAEGCEQVVFAKVPPGSVFADPGIPSSIWVLEQTDTW